jgi:thiamine monophosphate synthase
MSADECFHGGCCVIDQYLQITMTIITVLSYYTALHITESNETAELMKKVCLKHVTCIINNPVQVARRIGAEALGGLE